jgi:hypothetical protein
LSEALDRFMAADFDTGSRTALNDYLLAGGAWTGSDAQLLAKVPGLVHLIVGSGEFQLV